jgi:serine/threonine-protein kinase
MARSVGRYEIREELGRGGMAAVYLAHDPKLDRQVALKLMDQQMSSDPTFAARFEREAKTIAGLEHSAIVSLYDYGEADGWPYLVMRYMKGGSLKALIARGPLSPRQAYRIVQRIGSALDKAHRENIVHRDLKPANILLDEEQEAFLSDFGIVKVAKGDHEFLTQTGETVGTNAYMSPEQVMGQKLDGRSDIYALGLVLHEMLTGKHPYADSAMTSGAMAVAHVQAPVPKVVDSNPDLPAALDEVIGKAMAKAPGDRYATCREMTVALQAALSAPAKTTAAAATVHESPAAAPPKATAARRTQPPQTRQPATIPEVQPAEIRQPATTPATERSPETAVDQPGREAKRKTPVRVFVLIGVALFAVFCIALVAIGWIIGGEVEDGANGVNGNDSGSRADSSGGGDLNENTVAGDAQALFASAQESLQRGDDAAEALQLLNEAIDLDPNRAEYYALRADVKTMVSGDYESSLADLDAAIELDPTESFYYGTRGNMRREMGDYDLAEADYQKAIELRPEDPGLYTGLGRVYHQMGEADRATDSYLEAISLEPQAADHYIAFSSTLYFEGLGDADDAIEVLTACINEAQDRVHWCYWERAWIYDKEGFEDEASADLQVFMDTAPAGECAECMADAEKYLSGVADVCPTSTDGQLTVWIDAAQGSILRDLASDFEARCETKLVVEEHPVYEASADVISAAAAGEGPDLFFGYHDSLGSLMENSLLAPIDLGASRREFVPISLDAFTTGGDLYGMPVLLDSIALFRNTDLAPAAPQGWDELLELGSELQRSGEVKYAFALPVNAYYGYAIITNFDGYVFGRATDGTWDTGDLGIDGRGMMLGAKWILDRSDEGLAAWVDYDEAHSLFYSGATPFLLTGPWVLGEIQESGIPYAISQVPGSSQPFLGVFGFMVNAAQPDTELAQYFLTEFIADEEVMTEFTTSIMRPSAYSAVLRAADDPDLFGMGAASVNGTPLPAVPEMATVWGPWDQALSQVSSGELAIPAAFNAAAEQIRSDLR